MLEKIKALPDKTLFIIGITLQITAIVLIIAVGFINESTNSWIDIVFYGLYFTGLPFIMLAYDKRRKNKKR
ncbi:hypothetical protein [Ornithinibacillus californiensis]|uniref:hypothetical protein n=1 Tax=Ornithinibacillus californiensis TaxID=161536 RepID=UPI00064DE5D8|nr:hypothetical protein [Ornithinibacillus californiensis]